MQPQIPGIEAFLSCFIHTADNSTLLIAVHIADKTTDYYRNWLKSFLQLLSPYGRLFSSRFHFIHFVRTNLRTYSNNLLK